MKLHEEIRQRRGLIAAMKFAQSIPGPYGQALFGRFFRRESKSEKEKRPKWLVVMLKEKAETKRQMRREKRLYQVARGGMAMNDDRCVSRGDYVPEGRMVCSGCEMAASESADATVPFLDSDDITPVGIGFILPEGAPWYVRVASKIVARWFDRQGA